MFKAILRFNVLFFLSFYYSSVLADMVFYGDKNGVVEFHEFLISDSFSLSSVNKESSDEALYAAGFCYLRGCSEIGNDVDVDLAAKYLKYAEVRGVDDVYSDYAFMYVKGVFYPEDFNKGVAYLKKGAEKGDIRTMNTLGNIYTHGFRSISADRQEGIEWYRLAAEKGASRSMSKVYYYYADEKHPETFDLSKAFYWAKKIEEVHPDDIGRYTFKLGEIYEKGLGTQKNLILATRYYILGGSAGSDDVARLREKMTEEAFQEAVRLANEWQAEHRIRVPRYYQ
ncbi:hypothetical protein BFW38_05855 [Terasakiispira papahanaumokuakeensis]|uniref:Sel1 repeat family protein n=1 Tax=Terasakiispira papahanaumokuakeensis TaxID=197479 RepID=A0A1E2V800_9GAMM|nr:tetratricopeptide repeat protein [Terasakiispira papahanaumokuakeensis]ODC03139.1 hypothetical protein BFW38_05855 [Terasakiispira papahanaumokuakeensis]